MLLRGGLRILMSNYMYYLISSLPTNLFIATKLEKNVFVLYIFKLQQFVLRRECLYE